MRGKYFVKEVFLPASLSLRASVIHYVSMYPAWTCIWEYNKKSKIITIISKAWNMDWKKSWKFEDESRTSKLEHYWHRPEYREEFWRSEVTCCHSKSSQRSSANVGAKKLAMRICMVDFVVSVNHIVKKKEDIDKRDKFFDLARELIYLRTMRMTMIPIVISVLWAVPKGLERGLKELKIRLLSANAGVKD